MRESAVSAKRGWGWFGAKPAQSETPVGAAATRRYTRKRTQWGRSRAASATLLGDDPERFFLASGECFETQ